MTATATPATNGKPQRKQLSEQLDRMDTIIDALAEALPEAVADACREGARQAVIGDSYTSRSATVTLPA